MTAKPAATEKATPVDADKLWRDRVSSELLYQRSWENEYGFMLDSDQRQQRAAARGELETQAGNDDLKVSYKGVRSTQHAAHSGTRRNLEAVFSSQKEHNRRKHPM
eukprot:PhM_4_TR9402/c0_g1_i1/m.67797